MTNKIFDNSKGFLSNTLVPIKPVRPAPEGLETQILKLHGFISKANQLLENSKQIEKSSIIQLNKESLDETYSYFIYDLTAFEAENLLKQFEKVNILFYSNDYLFLF
jgi:hypothetical protein